MRQFLSVILIMFAIMFYGSAFIDDSEANRQAKVLGGLHDTVPQPRDNEVTISGTSDQQAKTLTNFEDEPEIALADNVKRDDEIQLNFVAGNGQAFKAFIKRENASVFLKSTVAYIEEKRRSTKKRMQERIAFVFKDAFADREASVGEFADWFYGFFTTFELAGKGLGGMFSELFSWDAERIKEAPVKAVEETMRLKYMETVLKPQLRDPKIVMGVEDAITEAHKDYLRMLQNVDERVVNFIGDKARYVESIEPKEVVKLKLDWDTESWRAPLERARQSWAFSMAGISLVAGGAIAGDVLLASFSSMFATVLAEAAIGAELVGGGAALGSVEPGAGTVIGAVAGLGFHGILSMFREHLDRESFVKETNAAVDTSIQRWSDTIEPKTDELIDRWFNETQKVIATPNLEGKLGS